jgi:hypothetical protein
MTTELAALCAERAIHDALIGQADLSDAFVGPAPVDPAEEAAAIYKLMTPLPVFHAVGGGPSACELEFMVIFRSGARFGSTVAPQLAAIGQALEGLKARNDHGVVRDCRSVRAVGFTEPSADGKTMRCRGAIYRLTVQGP